MALATIFKRFNFQLVSEVEDYFFLTLKPKVCAMCDVRALGRKSLRRVFLHPILSPLHIKNANMKVTLAA